MFELLKHQDLTFPGAPDGEPTDIQTAAALREFARNAVKSNSENLNRSFRFIDRSFTWLRVAYSAMLVFGFAALVAAIVKGLAADGGSEVGAAAVLGGVSATTFISAFIAKPTNSMERSSVMVPWMLLVLNTYWTRLLYITDPATQEAELKDAGNVANEQFKAIAEALTTAQAGEKEAPAGAADGNDAGDGSADTSDAGETGDSGTGTETPAAGTTQAV